MTNRTKFFLVFVILEVTAIAFLVVTYDEEQANISKCVETFESNASGCKELYGDEE